MLTRSAGLRRGGFWTTVESYPMHARPSAAVHLLELGAELSPVLPGLRQAVGPLEGADRLPGGVVEGAVHGALVEAEVAQAGLDALRLRLRVEAAELQQVDPLLLPAADGERGPGRVRLDEDLHQAIAGRGAGEEGAVHVQLEGLAGHRLAAGEDLHPQLGGHALELE